MVLSCLCMRWLKMNEGLSQWSSVHLSHGITMTWSWQWQWDGSCVTVTRDTWHLWGHCAMVSTRLQGGAGVEYRGLAAVATLLPTLVCTPGTWETLATMPLLNCKLCDHHFICFAWCFFGICFLYENNPKLLFSVTENYWQGATSGHNLCRRVARGSNCHQQRRGVTQHIRTFQVPSQDTGPAQAPQQLSVSFTTSLSGCDVIMQTSSFIQVPGPYFLLSVLNKKKQKLNMNNVPSCDIIVMLLLFNKVF